VSRGVGSASTFWHSSKTMQVNYPLKHNKKCQMVQRRFFSKPALTRRSKRKKLSRFSLTHPLTQQSDRKNVPHRGQGNTHFLQLTLQTWRTWDCLEYFMDLSCVIHIIFLYNPCARTISPAFRCVLPPSSLVQIPFYDTFHWLRGAFELQSAAGTRQRPELSMPRHIHSAWSVVFALFLSFVAVVNAGS
jgi:hypothetical protein